MFLQLHVGTQIERSAGWLRILLIYFIAGVGGLLACMVVVPAASDCSSSCSPGNVTSAVFAPQMWTVGATGALFGLLACLFVDLFNSWPMLEHPWRRLAMLTFEFILFALVGTLPWVDNWAHIGGFVFGIFAAMIFLPFITFGRGDKARKW